jgi:hypothetical protein
MSCVGAYSSTKYGPVCRAIVVSNSFVFPEWQEELADETTGVYIYRVPGKLQPVGGSAIKDTK